MQAAISGMQQRAAMAHCRALLRIGKGQRSQRAVDRGAQALPVLALIVGVQHHASLTDGDKTFAGLFQVEQQHLVGGDGIVEYGCLSESSR
ncbi:hypothetical protein D3C87_1858650 [compost metagenome]